MLSVLGFPSACVDVFCVNVHFTSRRGGQMQKRTSPVIITSFFSCTLGKDLTPSRSTSCTWKSCHSKRQGEQVWFPCQLGLATVPWWKHLPTCFELSCQVNATDHDFNWSKGPFFKWQLGSSWESRYIWAQMLGNANLSTGMELCSPRPKYFQCISWMPQI